MISISLLVSSFLWLLSFLTLGTVDLVQAAQLDAPSPFLRAGLLFWAGGQVLWIFHLTRRLTDPATR